MTITDTPIDPTPTDPARTEAFAERIVGALNDTFATLLIDVGHRTGLLDAAAGAPATSIELAERAGLDERYVREWLGAMTTAGIVEHDPSTATFTFPAEHAACLTGDTEDNLAPLSQICTHLAEFVGPVAEVFRTGGGIPYERYRPEFTDVMDGLSRPLFDGALVDGILPMVDGLVDRLAAGTRVADIGCGTGHSTNVLAQAFPSSTFVGFDFATDALERGQAEAVELALGNATFVHRDVAHLPSSPSFGVAFAFDAIHDQADPAGVLRRIHDALEPGGTFVMLDIHASSHLERNVDHPLGTLLYGISTLHCMTVSLASGGAGLGAVWGEELAHEMLADAGFVDIEIHEIPGDPIDVVFSARRPG